MTTFVELAPAEGVQLVAPPDDGALPAPTIAPAPEATPGS
jgi:hypothetical protein